ncbi:hypothetical protein MSKU3_3144 [Komagataeibacter oboediens]|nr:hypothetical protein MSKU3_3144 [Komagataeibacter oboediens]
MQAHIANDYFRLLFSESRLSVSPQKSDVSFQLFMQGELSSNKAGMISEADMSSGKSCLSRAASRVPLLFIHAQIQIREIQERRRDLMDACPPDQITNMRWSRPFGQFCGLDKLYPVVVMPPF